MVLWDFFPPLFFLSCGLFVVFCLFVLVFFVGVIFWGCLVFFFLMYFFLISAGFFYVQQLIILDAEKGSSIFQGYFYSLIPISAPTFSPA